MRRQIKRVLSILFLVLFVTTLTVSAVSAGSVLTLKASPFIVHDDYCGNGFHIVFPTNPNDPFHPVPGPDPEPWIVQGQAILSKIQAY
jgi:hypothetical protein